jgi:hypothetical protein
MPRLIATILNRQGHVTVEPSPSGQTPLGLKWDGLIDTGAQGSSLRRDVWGPAGFSDIGVRGSSTGVEGDPFKTKLFLADLHLSDSQGTSVSITGLVVSGLPENAPLPIVIGMDILSKCVLTLHGPNTKMTLDFP